MSDIFAQYLSALLAGSAVGIVVRWLRLLARPRSNSGGE